MLTLEKTIRRKQPIWTIVAFFGLTKLRKATALFQLNTFIYIVVVGYILET